MAQNPVPTIEKLQDLLEEERFKDKKVVTWSSTFDYESLRSYPPASQMGRLYERFKTNDDEALNLQTMSEMVSFLANDLSKQGKIAVLNQNAFSYLRPLVCSLSGDSFSNQDIHEASESFGKGIEAT